MATENDRKWINDPGPVRDADFTPTDMTFALMDARGVKPAEVPDPATAKVYKVWLATRKK